MSWPGGGCGRQPRQGSCPLHMRVSGSLLLRVSPSPLLLLPTMLLRLTQPAVMPHLIASSATARCCF